MTFRLGYDSSTPPRTPPRWAVVGFYVGGWTPHVWTADELRAQDAQWAAPLWVAQPTSDAAAARTDAPEAFRQLATLGVPKGITIWLDTETWKVPEYVAEFDRLALAEGYKAGNYASLTALLGNGLPSGGRWSADWNDIRHLDNVPGVKATQYADATMLGTDYDGSVWIDTGAHLWELNPPAAHNRADSLLAAADNSLHAARTDIAKARALVKG